MVNRRVLLAASGAAFMKRLASASEPSPEQYTTDPMAAGRDVLARYLGQRAQDFHLSMIPSEHGQSVFEISASDGEVQVKANSAVSALRAVYAYLRDNHLGMITWSGRRLQLPERWPEQRPLRVVCPYRFTQYLNPCTFGYSTPFWNWRRWERELDWMALHGINMPLALDGQEAVWQRVWSSFGVTEAEWNRFATGPAQLPWHRMGNINQFEGPIPQSWIEGKRQLQKRIVERAKTLGMTPIVPGFAGHVPEAFKRLYPRARISTLLWDSAPGFPRECRTFLLDPTERDLFMEIGRRFIESYKKEFDTGGYYLADPFNELQPPVSETHRYADLKQCAANIYAGIQAGDPDGVWVMQGWQYANNPKFWDMQSTQALLSGVPNDRLLTIDYASDMDSVHEMEYHNAPDAWKRLDAFFGKPWINGMAHTFGGNNNVKGNLPMIASKPAAVLANPAKGNLIGWGLDMEGIESNEVVYELMTDIGWTSTPVDLDSWIGSYCFARYGAYPARMRQAWQLLLRSAYGSDVWKTRQAFQSHPSLSPKPLHVDTSPEFQGAVELFISCADELGAVSLYRNDLIELVAQSVGGAVDHRLASACRAHEERRANDRDKQSKQAVDMLHRIDALLHTRIDRRLETWVSDARSWARSPDEAAFYDSNARLIITFWGWKELEDYASRVWSGLIRDYYAARWEVFFARLAGERGPSLEEWIQNWIATPYVASKPRPVDDVIAEARRMLEDCRMWT
ncbi:MAG: alpha-N-acetylglucosaminidase [Acidobacteriaceae bacterium]|nr:alpha-N-acetylglucosaminidase [Acidobacteriaceae bacterium]